MRILLFCGILHLQLFVLAANAATPFDFSAIRKTNHKMIDHYFLYNKSIRINRNFENQNNYLHVFSSFKKITIEQFYKCDIEKCKRIKFTLNNRVTRNQAINVVEENLNLNKNCNNNYDQIAETISHSNDIRNSIFNRFAKSEMSCNPEDKDEITKSFLAFLNNTEKPKTKKCIDEAQPDSQLFLSETEKFKKNINTFEFEILCNYKQDKNFHASIEILKNKIIVPVPKCWSQKERNEAESTFAHEFSHFINPIQDDNIAKAVSSCFGNTFVKDNNMFLKAEDTAEAAETQTASINSKVDEVIPAETPGLDRTSSAPPIALWNQVMGMVSRANAEVIKQVGEDPFHMETPTLATLPNANSARSPSTASAQASSTIPKLQYTAAGEAIRPDIQNNELYANRELKAELKAQPQDLAKKIPTSGTLIAKDDSQFTPDPSPSSANQAKAISQQASSSQGSRNIASTGSASAPEPPQEVSYIQSALKKAQSRKAIEQLSAEFKKKNILIILNEETKAKFGGKSKIGNEVSPKKIYTQNESGKLEPSAKP